MGCEVQYCVGRTEVTILCQYLCTDHVTRIYGNVSHRASTHTLYMYTCTLHVSTNGIPPEAAQKNELSVLLYCGLVDSYTTRQHNTEPCTCTDMYEVYYMYV